MKILGSGKIDDFQKIILGDKVTKALNVKPGDSILFYRGEGDRVEMFKAEGAHVTDECDSRPSLHLRGLRSLLKTLLAISLVLTLICILLDKGLQYVDHNLDQEILDNMSLIIMCILVVLIIAMLAGIRSMDYRGRTEKLVSVGGPYSKDRLVGMTKLMSDGRIVTGSLYMNALFGQNPVSVGARIEYDDGREDVALTKCIKSVPGYSLYKVRFQSEKMSSGNMVVDIVYRYSEKIISVKAYYRLDDSPGMMSIKVTEGEIVAELHFDDMFQRSTFDESIFDPTDDDLAL